MKPHYEMNIFQGWERRDIDHGLVGMQDAFAALSEWLRRLIECCLIRSTVTRRPVTQTI